MTKLVYIYEGVEKDAPHSKRYHLVNPYYFCGTYEGKDNETLWNQVYQYIEDNYEIDKIKKIFLNADEVRSILCNTIIMVAKRIFVKV